MTRPVVQLQGCREWGFGLDVPLESVRAVVPQEFEIASRLVPGTGAVTAFITECERTLDDSALLGPGRYWRVYVFVNPRNDSWAEEGYIDRYLLDFASDNPGLVGAFRNLSLPVVNASLSTVAAPSVQGVQASTWKVEAADWMADLVHTVSPRPDAPQNLSGKAHEWSGTGPFHRLKYRESYVADTFLGVGHCVFTGQSALGRALPGGVSPAITDAYSNVDGFYQYDGAWTV